MNEEDEQEKESKVGNKIKNILKHSILKLFTWKVVLVIAIIIVIIAVFSASLFEFRVSQTKNSNDPESKYYREYGPEAYMDSVYIAEDGTLMAEMSIDDMWENDDRYSTYLSSKEALAYFLNAQLVTQYPYIESAEEGQLNGTIKFYRNDSDEPMVYMTQDDFDSMLNSGGEDILNYFTVTSSGSLKIAYTTSTTYTLETDDENVEDSASKIGFETQYENSKNGDEYSIETAIISYRSLVRKYVLPFNLLWSMIIMGNSVTGGGSSENFAHAVATMAYEGEISLIIDDNEVITVDTDTYTYSETEHYDGSANARIHETDTETKTSKYYNTSDSDLPSSMKYTTNNDTYDIGSYKTIYTEIHITHSPSPRIKKATSWVATYTDGATYQTSTTSNESNPDVSSLDDTDLIKDRTENKDGNIPAVNGKPSLKSWVNYWNKYYNNLKGTAEEGKEYDIYYTVGIDVYKNYTDINLSSALTTTTTSFMNNGSVTSPSLNQSIVSLFNVPTFSGIKKSLAKTSYSYFIEAIEGNDDTANMVDLINYIFNKVYNTDRYYTGDEDFVTIWNRAYSNYTSVSGGQSGIDGNKGICFDYFLDKGCSPEGIAALLGCWQIESGFMPNNLENKNNSSLGLSDEQYTAQVNNGTRSRATFISEGGGGDCGYGLAQWTATSRKTGLYDFASNYSSFAEAYTNRSTPYTSFDISDIYMQLDYCWYGEFNGDSYYSPALEQLQNGTDLSTALYKILQYYEGAIASGYYSARLAAAQPILDEYYANNQ